MECVDLQTFHKHYCAMVISYNVANCFFGGVRVVFLFFLYFLGGWVSLSLGILSEVLSGRDFVGHFVRGGDCRGFYPEGLLSFFFVRGVFDGEGLSRFFVNEVFVGGFLSAGFVGGFCRVFFIGGVFVGGFSRGGGVCRRVFVGGFLPGGFCRGVFVGGVL